MKRSEAEAAELTEEEQEAFIAMLVGECEEMLCKEAPEDESLSGVRDRNRLEREYIQVCLEVDQQKDEIELDAAKMRRVQAEAELLSKQILDKEEILRNLRETRDKEPKEALKAPNPKKAHHKRNSVF